MKKPSMSILLQSIKTQIQSKIPAHSYQRWLAPLTQVDESRDCLTVGCPNKFSLTWITEHYKSLLEKACNRITGRNIKLQLTILENNKVSPRENALVSRQLRLPNMPEKTTFNRAFRKDLNFERFVVGHCNEFAYAVAKAMVADPSCAACSLFISSSTGLGKSHLSQAMGNYLFLQNPQLRACYITAEDFLNGLTRALRTNSMEEFKARYRRSCDFLILEDVHFLGGKSKCQTELLYTLDALFNADKKIVFTSSLLPREIPNLNNELLSRFSSGLMSEIKKPDQTTRRNIIVKKSREMGLDIAPEIVEMLADKLTQDVRYIESILKCIKAHTDFNKTPVDKQSVQSILRYYLPKHHGITIYHVRDLICQYYKIDPVMLEAKSRKKIYSHPRNMFVYLCRQYTEATLEDIGLSIKRKHSTVIYASEVIEKAIKQGRTAKKEAAFLQERLLVNQ